MYFSEWNLQKMDDQNEVNFNFAKKWYEVQKCSPNVYNMHKKCIKLQS